MVGRRPDLPSLLPEKNEITNRENETFDHGPATETLHPFKRSHQEALQHQPQKEGEDGDQDNGGAIHQRAEGFRVHHKNSLYTNHYMY